MANLVQIKVDTVELEKSEKELLTKLKKKINISAEVHFINAKGSVADNLITVATQLNEIGDALANLIHKTQTAITNTRVTFTNTDNMLAQWWGSSEE